MQCCLTQSYPKVGRISNALACPVRHVDAGLLQIEYSGIQKSVDLIQRGLVALVFTKVVPIREQPLQADPLPVPVKLPGE